MESILLVDDEEELRKIMALILEGLGYRVAMFGNGADVLHELEKNQEKYDLLISDMTMSGMTGVQLAKEVAKIRPARRFGPRHSAFRRLVYPGGAPAFARRPDCATGTGLSRISADAG